jgi:hypothetical protein
MVSKLKRPPREWEKIFASYPAGKRLITRIDRELKKLNSPQTNESIKKQTTEQTELFQRKKSKWPKNTGKNAHHLWP